jgi:hypothetical protein
MQLIINLVKQYWLALTLLTLTAITALSLWPLSTLPSVPGSDKLHHFIAYAALVLPTALRKPKYWPLITVGFIGWSGAIELIQPSVDRYGEWADLLANSVGVGCGLALAGIIELKYK